MVNFECDLTYDWYGMSNEIWTPGLLCCADPSKGTRTYGVSVFGNRVMSARIEYFIMARRALHIIIYILLYTCAYSVTCLLSFSNSRSPLLHFQILQVSSRGIC